MWWKKLIDYCIAHDLEPYMDPNGVLQVNFRKQPTLKIQDEIKAIIPDDLEVEYSTGPRMTTLQKISVILRMAGATEVNFRQGTEERTLAIMVKGIPAVNAEVKQTVGEIVSKDGYVKKAEVLFDKSEGRASAGPRFTSDDLPSKSKTSKGLDPHPQVWDRLVKEFEGNQEKGEYITKDTLLNLKIDLGRANTIEDFLKILEG